MVDDDGWPMHSSGKVRDGGEGGAMTIIISRDDGGGAGLPLVGD